MSIDLDRPVNGMEPKLRALGHPAPDRTLRVTTFSPRQDAGPFGLFSAMRNTIPGSADSISDARINCRRQPCIRWNFSRFSARRSVRYRT
jgi:hypothetical protein